MEDNNIEKTISQEIEESNIDEELKKRVLSWMEQQNTTIKELSKVVDTYKIEYANMCEKAKIYKGTIIEFVKDSVN